MTETNATSIATGNLDSRLRGNDAGFDSEAHAVLLDSRLRGNDNRISQS